MPVNNALTPEGQNALGAAFGYYPQLRRNRTVQDPRLAAEMPLQFLRGRVAGTLGLPSDVANLVRSPLPMEMFGDVDYGPQTQVPYGSQELLRTLPLPPQGAAQQAAANVGAVIPLTPMEALQAARLARQAALATGKTLGPTAAGMAEGFLQRQGLMPGVLPNNLGGKAATKIDELTGLPLNSDGTVTLFHHTNKSAAEQIAKSGRLKSAGEPSVYLTTQKVTDTGYGDVAVPVRVQPSLLNLDDQFPGGRMDFSIDTGKPKGSIPVTVEKQSFQYPQENAMRLAQQRAALPVEQGGLGLAAGNTAEQRAGAMGGKDMVHFSRAGGDYTTLDSGKFAIAPFDAVGTHVGTPQAAMERFQNTVGYKVNNPNYANDELRGTTYPVKILGNKPLMNQNGMPFGEDDLNTFLRQQGGHNYSDIQGGKMTYQDMNADLRKKLFEEQGYTSIPYYNEVEGKGSISYIVPPENIRSRFAAFDPFRKSAAVAAAMGVAAPDLLAEEDNSVGVNKMRKLKANKK